VSAPNILNATSCIGKTTAYAATATVSAVITNTASSNTLYKINTIVATNSSTSATTVSIDLYRTLTSFPIASNITVPAGTMIVILGKDTPIYLEEGDALRFSAGVASAITTITSYEVIS
jgi:hypothetical protein